MINYQDIQQKESQLANLENRLAVLQIPIAEPQAENFDDVDLLFKARRDWQQAERDRLDELAASQTIFEKLQSKLATQKQEYADLEAKVKAGFEQVSDAALKANKLLDSAYEAIAKVEALALEQANAGHAMVYGHEPYQKYADSIDFPIFVVTSGKVTQWERQKFADCERSGNIGEGTKT